MRVFSSLFWGVFLLSSGALLLLKSMFGWQASTSKLIFGVFVLLFGVSLLTTNMGIRTPDNTSLFSSGPVRVTTNSADYNTVFGSNTYDLTDVAAGSNIKINCVFGNARVKVPHAPYIIRSNCAFGSVRMPNGTSYAFGEGNYNNGGQDSNVVWIDVSCAFGEIVLYE